MLYRCGRLKTPLVTLAREISSSCVIIDIFISLKVFTYGSLTFPVKYFWQAASLHRGHVILTN
ncbi:MAG: hypothetical protein WBM86_28805, partial [Waterburya sp.]